MLKILVVSDDRKGRKILTDFLKFKGYDVVETDSKNEISNILEKEGDIDVMLLDAEMFTLDELKIVKELKMKDFPIVVILMVEFDETIIRSTMERAAENGVDRLLIKPVDLPLLLSELVAIEKFKKFHIGKGKVYSKDKKRIEELALSVRELAEENKHLSMELVRLVYTLSEYRDDETHAHTTRVGWVSGKIASKLGIDEEEALVIQLAAPMHDIGKIGIPDSILLKPARLTEEEYEKMKKHTLMGYEILKDSSSKILKEAAIISLTHHERWDGSGYPKGLKGDEIPIEGLIVAVADSFDAMVCKRVYKKPIPLEKAFEEIKSLSGKWYSPEVVKAFIDLESEIYEYYIKSCKGQNI